MKIERRFISELRADSQGEEMNLVGYAAKFNNPSEDLGGFRETILPGAFARSIREGQDVRFLMNHSPDKVMGRTKNGTMTLAEDGIGLRFKVKLPDTQDARDLYTLVKRGDIDSCSFAFTARDQSWEDVRSENGDIYANRKLLDVDLQDCSAVTYPAYPNTEVNARALFPDGEPVELRSAITSLVEKRKKFEDGDPKQGEEASDQKSHEAAADAHKKASGKEMNAGHMPAAHAHMDAAFKHKQAAEGKGASQDAQNASKDANHASEVACRTSKEAEEKRAAGQALVIQPNDKTFPQPFDDDMKSKWCDAYADALKDAIKRQKLEYQDAVAYAYKEANQSVQPKTEVDPEIAGQKKDPSSIKGDIVDTNAHGKPADQIDAKKNPGRSLEEEIEERVYKTPDHPNGKEDVPSNVPDSKKAQWKEVWNSVYKKAKSDGKSNEDAETMAFTQANGVIKKRAKSCDCRCEMCSAGNHRSCSGNPACVLGRSHKVSDPKSKDFNKDDEDYDPDWENFEDEEAGDDGRKKDKDSDDEERSGEKDKEPEKDEVKIDEEAVLASFRSRARLIEIELDL